jgi:26S proteasome regulatory subunit N5
MEQPNKDAAPKTSAAPAAIAGIEKKEDFTEVALSTIAEAEVLANSGEINRAIEILFALEKKCRLGNDILSLKKVVLAMVNLCYDKGNWEKLNTTLSTIAKRHQQSRHAISAVIEKAIEWIPSAPDKETKVAFLVVLREITDGKIYLEAERARLTRDVAMIKEADGDINGACDAMLDVYVETYGALSKREKIDFILDQIRLCILKQDWVRVVIVAKKVQRKFLEEADMQDLKLRYYGLLVEFYLQEKNAMELATAFYQMYTTPCKAEDEDETTGWRYYLKGTVLFLCLAKHSPEQSDMIHRVALDEKLSKLPDWLVTIKLFTTSEIIHFPLVSQEVVESQLKIILDENKASDMFDHWRLMTHTRSTQHNLRVAAKYYKQIRISRLAVLLGLSEADTEVHLSALVSEGEIFAKMDRPAGIVRFAPKVSAEETLTEWASDIDELLSLVERTCHLINKENMIHKI